MSTVASEPFGWVNRQPERDLPPGKARRRWSHQTHSGPRVPHRSGTAAKPCMRRTLIGMRGRAGGSVLGDRLAAEVTYVGVERRS